MEEVEEVEVEVSEINYKESAGEIDEGTEVTEKLNIILDDVLKRLKRLI